jgi:acetate kinase
MVMTQALIVINTGSTSVKFGAYALNGFDAAKPLTLLCRGDVADMQGTPVFQANNGLSERIGTHAWQAGTVLDCRAALSHLLGWVQSQFAGMEWVAAGHRVVLGGARFDQPTVCNDDALVYLESLQAIEPSHQAFNVMGVRALAELMPGMIQIACFDNAFHRTMPAVAQTYALPQDMRDMGVKHWGYHGLSYDFISQQLPQFVPKARRVIVAHLGGGASMCAMLDGRSQDTSMGFGGLSGLPMLTRSGDVPPEAIFYLLRSGQFDAALLEKALYERAGLLGMSGISGDMRVLQDSKAPAAMAAVDHFVHALCKFTGAYMATLGGLDAFVFTAGLGEHAAKLRSAWCLKMSWLGVKLDEAANAANGPCISTLDSSVSVWVIPTNEEWMLAQYTLQAIKDQTVAKNLGANSQDVRSNRTN